MDSDKHQMPIHTKNAIKIILLTGVRTSELRLAQWDEFNFEASFWTIPAGHSKVGTAIKIHLNPQVKTLLREMKSESDSIYVLPSVDGNSPIEVKATPKFMRLAKKSMTQEAIQGLIDLLTLDPEKGTLIKGAGGIRKIRWATGKGGGKRGGLRVLYHYDEEQIVLLVTLFKKADQENIDAGEKEELRNLIQQLCGD